MTIHVFSFALKKNLRPCLRGDGRSRDDEARDECGDELAKHVYDPRWLFGFTQPKSFALVQ